VAGAQFNLGLRLNRTFEVQMQLDLGQAEDEILYIGHNLSVMT
jgi:hypothetical protein